MKLPMWAKRHLARHDLFYDVAATILTFFLLGTNVIAIIAGAYVGILFSVVLWYNKNYLLKEIK